MRLFCHRPELKKTSEYNIYFTIGKLVIRQETESSSAKAKKRKQKCENEMSELKYVRKYKHLEIVIYENIKLYINEKLDSIIIV